MLRIITGVILSYLIGSIPTAYIFGRILKGIDIRKFGSGNVGATNALRVLGKGPGILVLLLDVFKGMVPILFLSDFALEKTAFSNEIVYIIFGISCIIGHNWTVFLNFHGGKGIATTLGVLAGMSFKIEELNIILVMLILTWLLTFIISRIVSLSSIISALVLPILMFWFKQSEVMIFTGIILSVFVILRHKSNLKRLMEGKEPKLLFKKSA